MLSRISLTEIEKRRFKMQAADYFLYNILKRSHRVNLNHILDNYSYSLSSSINLKSSRKEIKAKIIPSIGK